MAVFGETLGLLRGEGVAFEPVLPTMPHLLEAVRKGVESWPVQPRIVIGEQEKRAAFRIARAALAKSGTVTLELALAGVPMVAAYRTGAIEAWIMLRVINVPSVILANLVIGENVVPEFLQQDCTPEKLSQALREVLVEFPIATPAGRSFRKARHDHVDRRSDAERAGGRYRAGGHAEGAGGGLGSQRMENAKAGRGDRVRLSNGHDACELTSACRSRRSRGGPRRCRAGADGRSSAPDPRSSPSTARSSRRCGRPRTAR